MNDMKIKDCYMDKWLKHDFESSSYTTPDFAAFAKDFKKYLTAILPSDIELINFNRGHFYLSGFFKKGDKYVYFSTSDVRGNTDWYKHLLIRTAKHDKDYRGGNNNYCMLPEIIYKINILFNCFPKEAINV